MKKNSKKLEILNFYTASWSLQSFSEKVVPHPKRYNT